MALLKKINVDGEYSFDYVEKESYSCDVHRKYNETEMANGKIKRVYQNYEQVEISISLALLSTDNIDDIFENLVDGTYEYDYKGKMVRANFVIDKDPLEIRDSSSKYRYNNLEIELKKSSDYEEGVII